MYRTILVPLDGSSFGERALPLATSLVREIAGRLILMHAASATAVPGLDSLEAEEHAVREAETYLAGVAAQLGKEGVETETAAPFGPAVSSIVMEIGLRKADMVVMCTHGRSGFGRWIYGSVAGGVLGLSPVPVVLVQASDAPPTAPQLHGARLLAPLDGSSLAEAILPHARTLARILDASLTLVRVVVPVVPQVDGPPMSLLEASFAAEEAAATAYMRSVSDRLSEEGLTVQTAVRQGSPSETILQEAQATGASMILMATHGRTGLRELLLGSVALQVLKRGPLPLLLVHPR